MSALGTPFPATGEEEELARTLVDVLKGCELLHDLVGASPTRFTGAVEDVAWRLCADVWGNPSQVYKWIALEGYGLDLDEEVAS